MKYWRTAYEGYAAAAWGASFILMLVIAIKGELPSGPFYWMAGISFLFLTFRLRDALKVWRARNALAGKEVEFISTEEVRKKMKKYPDHVWLGRGFDWNRTHTQKVYDLTKLDIADLKPPFFYRWFAKNELWNKEKKGSGFIHGVEEAEKDVVVPLSDLNGHTFVCATTGAMKTRLLSLVVCQAIHREPRECVIVIDPKGDRELLDMMKIECERAGRSSDFSCFHPAFPQESIRLDPMKNWNRPTELASRIAALIPGDSSGDVFTSFGWRGINLVAEGLIFVEESPSLKSLKRYIESGPDLLVGKTIERHMQNLGMNIDEAVEVYLQQVNAGKTKKPSPETPNRVVALAACYKHEIQDQNNCPVVDGLLSLFEHNREHMGKMLASLIPILTMLTAGEVGDLLSPNRTDAKDLRPILDTENIITSNKVVYIGLDSLTDATVSSAIGSIILADMVAVAGSRYNYGDFDNFVNLFNDEVNENVNIPLIQMLNKSRGANFRLMILTQTVNDLTVRLGSEAHTWQLLGNCNNLIAGRLRDQETKKYVSESFKKTTVETAQETKMTSAKSGGEAVAQFNASYGTRLTDTEADLISPDMLSEVPDLEFFASTSAGRVSKGRIPLITY
jgi:conjugal transfer pilus assembly protein TraD